MQLLADGQMCVVGPNDYFKIYFRNNRKQNKEKLEMETQQFKKLTQNI